MVVDWEFAAISSLPGNASLVFYDANMYTEMCWWCTLMCVLAPILPAFLFKSITCTLFVAIVKLFIGS